jgi:hypothetical protein
MPTVIHIQVQRAPGDCTITALSMLLGVPYEDVLGAAVKSTSSARVHHNGMFTRQMKATAKRLGQTLALRRGFDLERDEGILTVVDGDHQHAVLLKSGLIFDGDGSVWNHAAFMKEYRYRPVSLLVRTDA